MLEMVSIQYTRVLVFGESGVGDGLSPIHSCFGVWWSLVLEMDSVYYTC